MKILMLNAHESKGGAARAARRICDALSQVGVDVQFQYVYPQAMGLRDKGRFLFRALRDRLPALLSARKRVMFSAGFVANPALVAKINTSDADIVHLHWVNAGALSIADLLRIEKPLIWTLHDNWAFTGGCHVMWDCQRYTSGCGACPVLGSGDAEDLSARLYRRKRLIYERLNLTFTCVSRWLAECAQASGLTYDQNIAYLPNMIDCQRFTPGNQMLERERLDIPLGRQIILFGANAALRDANKGYVLLLSALADLPPDADIELVFFGDSSSVDSIGGFPVRWMGHVADDAVLIALYRAADVMVVPSLQESFGQTALEAMACGTPVVAFAATGLVDIVDHQINGYLAKPYIASDIAQGIEWVLGHPDYPALARAARVKAESCFDQRHVALQYLNLYERKLLEARKSCGHVANDS
ncbi:glycosyltransferase family 4 protein [Phytopseudomonas dryadis]|uniref:Glycosyl transferase n=1 Tax=Phytopseudomonas dryadis TaxID=2487520 RepID=A0A4Q9QTH4_9GAMM|nr:glycosyltransferase family 4 protein [Pseudomonas dryadis]TBU86362.1 glycosyl transferase [Pseudomonas dryadis]